MFVDCQSSIFLMNILNAKFYVPHLRQSGIYSDCRKFVRPDVLSSVTNLGVINGRTTNRILCANNKSATWLTKRVSANRR